MPMQLPAAQHHVWAALASRTQPRAFLRACFQRRAADRFQSGPLGAGGVAGAPVGAAGPEVPMVLPDGSGEAAGVGGVPRSLRFGDSMRRSREIFKVYLWVFLPVLSGIVVFRL